MGMATPPTARRFVDLHMHSTASDGLLVPEQVVGAAHTAGLAAIALTDHDTVQGVAAAHEAGQRLGVRVIRGVELSAHEGDREMHVLGLHLARLAELEERLAQFRETRRARAEQIVAKLAALGIPVSLDAVLLQAGGGAVGRPHIARALAAGGWVTDQREAFDRYIGAGRPAYVPKHRLPLEEAVRLIHVAGGLAIVAHPGPDGTRARLERLAGLGFDGAEVRHPSHNAEDVARIAALVDFLGLVPSGGSDWHGTPEGPRTIGNQQVPYEWLERQDARLAARTQREVVA